MLESVRSRAVLSGVVVGTSLISFRVAVDPGVGAEAQMEYFCSAEVDGIPCRFRVRCSEDGPIALFHKLGGTDALREQSVPTVSASLRARIDWGGVPLPAEITHLSAKGAGFRIASRLDTGDEVRLLIESEDEEARLDSEVSLVRGPTPSGKYVGWLTIRSADRVSRARWLRLVAEGDPLLNAQEPRKKRRRSSR